jgi:IS1 family transposase
VQRYRCIRCGKTFSEDQPLDGVRIDDAEAAHVVHLLCEGVGIRAISRLANLHQKTVLNVLESAGSHCARLLDARIRNVAPEQIQIDELYSFVHCRPENIEANHPQFGEFYCYLSIERHTKLMVNWLVDKRNGTNCRLFMEDLKQRVATKFQLSTDGYGGYTGYTGAVFQTFKHAIDYGTEVKAFGPAKEGPRRFNPPVVKWVRRTPQIGEPDRDKINTSRAERLNLSVRLFNRRFTRCTLGYSKKVENHRHAVAILVAYYNFCRIHSAHGQTPAHAAGLTDHTWTIKDLLAVAI